MTADSGATRLRVWGWPLGLGASSTFGLLSALLGQGGVWWVLSWIALAVPLLVILLHLCFGASGPSHERGVSAPLLPDPCARGTQGSGHKG